MAGTLTAATAHALASVPKSATPPSRASRCVFVGGSLLPRARPQFFIDDATQTPAPVFSTLFLCDSLTSKHHCHHGLMHADDTEPR